MALNGCFEKKQSSEFLSERYGKKQKIKMKPKTCVGKSGVIHAFKF